MGAINQFFISINLMSYILEFSYIGCGIICILAALRVDSKAKEQKVDLTGMFWKIAGITFILPAIVNLYGLMMGYSPKDEIMLMLSGYVNTFIGVLIIGMALLTLLNKVTTNIEFKPTEFKESEKKSLGAGVFVGPVSLALFAFLVAQFIPSLGGNVGLVVGTLVGLAYYILKLKPSAATINNETAKVLVNLGPTALLPQLLVALGALFTAAGVGGIISFSLSGVVPEGSLIIGITLYCVGMALFTMIMGNAFAAFSTITVGIGIPFVYTQPDANIMAIGALALTAGYCGTLLTPMAANFNIIPAKLLDMKDEYGVIKYQAPFAIAMLAIHIVLMYVLGFMI